ncbi:MAG TPA: SCO family protein [Dictyobacter sp.]|jgi:cytochrome oxidase Cu insertion factor (SCO1/SenC/PrrC family)|nr:SCO family protein [Dictyobacter sp.]
MGQAVDLHKLVRATFIATLVLAIIVGGVWGIRLVTLFRHQSTTSAADAALGGFPVTGVAPDFKLVDQFGHAMTLSSLRGHEVVLAFIDAQCTTLCPFTAAIMSNARTRLGSSVANQIDLVAVNANPDANSITDVQKWSSQHGMLHQWRFVTGTSQQLLSVYHAYKVYDQVSTDGEVVHDAVTFIIDAQGNERLYYETLDSSRQSDLNSEELGLAAGMRQWLPSGA